MKRIAVCMLLATAMSVGFVGCAEKTVQKDVKQVSTPGGSKTEVTTHVETKTGDQKENPPPANP
jgi:hypothetical protein